MLYALSRIPFIAAADTQATIWLHGQVLEHSALESVVLMVTNLGQPILLSAIVLAISIGLIVHSKRDIALQLMAVTAVGAIVETGLKLTIRRARPDLETALLAARGTSFPSGHAMNTAIVLGTVTIAISLAKPSAATTQITRSLAFLAIASVALSRPMLGVHHFSDIVAGLILAATWIALVRTSGYLQQPIAGPRAES